MTVPLNPEKLTKVQTLVATWSVKHSAILHDLLSLLGKLLYIAQVCEPAHLFLNGMLQTLRQCPISGAFSLSPEFCKDIAWFKCYLSTTDEVYIIHQEGRRPIHFYMDACESGCGAITTNHTYHARFPASVFS